MRYKVWDSGALDIYEKAGLSHRQQAFVVGLLRSLEAGTYLSEHVACARSAVLALTRAHHVLDEHALRGQPYMDLARTILAQSVSDVASGVSAYSTTASGIAAITQAQHVLRQVDVAMAGSPSRADKRQFANQVGALVQPVADTVRSIFEDMWTSSGQSIEVIARIRDEVAVLVTLTGRDGKALQVDLLRLFDRGVVEAAAVGDVLWPVPKRYRVGMVVSGTRLLGDLDRLLPGAQQWPLSDTDSPKGGPYREIRRLVDPASLRTGSTMLIVLPESAPDAYTAIAQARRSLVEALDQYAAGQRLLELDTDPPAVALADSNSSVMNDARTGGSRIARPLTDHWPGPLRSALRMANLAGRMDAPVASVALAWGAIESLFVDRMRREDDELIAKACALHCLRQQILSVYKSVTDAGNARLRVSQVRINLARKSLDKARRGYHRAASGDSHAAGEAAVRLETSIVRIQAELERLNSDYAQLEQNLLPYIEIVRRNLLRGGNQGQPLSMSSYLLNLNDFLDSILPLNPTSSAEVVETHDALAALASEAGGLAEEQLITWQHRLADPSALADWLNYQQAIFYGLVAWMYASRNLAIHAGRFSVPADVLTAQAGRGIVDMILEFLGHWYQNQHNQGIPDSDAKAVLQELADRKDALDRELRAATSCHPLNVVTITAPDGDPWRR